VGREDAGRIERRLGYYKPLRRIPAAEAFKPVDCDNRAYLKKG
jgi:hypothetical protein